MDLFSHYLMRSDHLSDAYSPDKNNFNRGGNFTSRCPPPSLVFTTSKDIPLIFYTKAFIICVFSRAWYKYLCAFTLVLNWLHGSSQLKYCRLYYGCFHKPFYFVPVIHRDIDVQACSQRLIIRDSHLTRKASDLTGGRTVVHLD